ncbi:MAG: glycosyltransferase, partial [Candidatus Helarchaeota archaeon]
ATPEVIRDNIDGLLVPFGNPKILANAIIKLLKNPELRDKFGENGYEKIKNQTWESVSTSIERIYKKLVQK